MKPLFGCSILVTRPQHQADQFCLMLEQAGATVLRFPTISIESTVLNERTLQTLKHLEQQDIVLFSSANAVHFCLPWLKPHINQTSAELPFKIAAIGKKTAQSLQTNHFNVQILPTNNFNSESLLALPDMQSVANKNILIVKGEGGRTLLRDTLQTRGANVTDANIYYRKRPTPDALMLDTLKSKKIDIITLTSVESSENLFALLENQSIKWLSSSTLLLGSKRIYLAIDNNSYSINNKQRNNPLWVAKNPSDDAMFAALLEWKNKHFE